MNLKLALKSGAVIPVLLMLPNVAWMLFYSLDAGAKSAVPVALATAENVARFVALALPFFYRLNLKRAGSTAVLIGMAGALAIYYVAWGRFFTGGGSIALFERTPVGDPFSARARPGGSSAALVVSDEFLVDVQRRLVFRRASCLGLVPNRPMTTLFLLQVVLSSHKFANGPVR